MAFLCKEAKRKQKWTTFTRIHRRACQQNTLPCALNTLKHRVLTEVLVCLLGLQFISRGFTLRKVQYHQYTRSRKIHWTLITHEMRETCKSIFSEKRSLEVSLGPPLLPYWEMSVSKIDFFFDWVGLYSRYVFNLLALQIHDIVNEDGPILESRCIQLRHTKL